MEKDETLTPDYIIGFNQGFIIQQNLPGLADHLPSKLTESDRSKGFQDGRNYYQMLKSKERHPYLSKYETNSKAKTVEPKSIDKSKDHGHER